MIDTDAHNGPGGEGAERAVTLGIVALAAALRLPDLFGWWPNPDEGIYYGAVTRESLGAVWAEAMATAHPPLYFLVLRGVGWLSTDFVAFRSVALLSGCLAVYVFVLIGRELGGEGRRGQLTGLIAGLLLAVSPRAVTLSQVIRPYMLLVLLLGASLLCLLRYLRAPSRPVLVGHAAASVMAVSLHYSSVFALGGMGVIVMVDGIRRGMRRDEWRNLVGAQAAPVALLSVLYFVHFRGVVSGPMGQNAMEGWLAPYLIRGPLDVWLGFVGFHSMLVGDVWAAPAAVVTLGVLAAASILRDRPPLLIATVLAFLVAIAGAALQLYPFGPTRHNAWLLVFVIPALAWAAGAVIAAGRPVLRWAIPVTAVTILGGRALAPVLDPESRPREISEHVLEEAAVAAMTDVLSTSGPPDLVLMSTETFELLTPLYTVERRTIRASGNGELRHFRWGVRDVVVLPTRDFAAKPEQLRQLNHLYTAARVAEAEFGIRMPRGGEPALVLSGGWRSQGMEDLVEMARRVGPLGTTTSVPGLVALYLDMEAFERALTETPGP